MWEIFEKKVAIDKYEMWILGLETKPDLKTFLVRGVVFALCFINILLAIALSAGRFEESFYSLPDWAQGLVALLAVGFCLLISAILSRFLNIWAYKKASKK